MAVAFSLNFITANYLKHGSPLSLLLTNLIKASLGNMAIVNLPPPQKYGCLLPALLREAKWLVSPKVDVSWILMSCVWVYITSAPYHFAQRAGCFRIVLLIELEDLACYKSKIGGICFENSRRQDAMIVIGWMYFVWRSNQCWTGLRFYSAAVLYLPLVRDDPGQAIDRRQGVIHTNGNKPKGWT